MSVAMTPMPTATQSPGRESGGAAVMEKAP